MLPAKPTSCPATPYILLMVCTFAVCPPFAASSLCLPPSSLPPPPAKTKTHTQAYKLQRQGWTLVDVRLATDFERISAEGSINVPMYRCVYMCVGGGVGVSTAAVQVGVCYGCGHGSP